MDVLIRRASPDEASVLTEIAHSAKRHWGYPEKWIQHWQADLTITPEFIADNEVYVAIKDGEIAGCGALSFGESNAELEHLWIRPEHMGSGIGRALVNNIRARAESLHLPALELSADPNAEGFYTRMGAQRIGDVRSEIEGQLRVLPRMMIKSG